MPESKQDGLRWDGSGWTLEPAWTREPPLEDIATICRQRLGVDDNDICEVSFYAQGVFNKLYHVRLSDRSLLMRVSLPVCPHRKTRGEVATLRWIRENTTIPVPTVLDFDDSNKNEIGFEWIMMELMPGTVAWRRWRHMTMAQKVFLTQRIAECQAQLFRRGSSAASFRGIGTLESTSSKQQSFTIEQLVSMEYFMGQRIEYDVPRGPFGSSHDWLESFLSVLILEQEKSAATTEDEDDKENYSAMAQVAKRLLGLLPKIFPPVQTLPERTALYHGDLGLANILVDDEGNLTAIVDWECVSTMPLWRTTEVPKFLAGPDRNEVPNRDTYSNDPPARAGDWDEKHTGTDEMDNEGKNELYWIHLMEYEQTQLRRIYVDKIRSMWPEWDLIAAESKLQNDFCQALDITTSGFFLGRIREWIDTIESGHVVDLDV